MSKLNLTSLKEYHNMSIKIKFDIGSGINSKNWIYQFHFRLKPDDLRFFYVYFFKMQIELIERKKRNFLFHKQLFSFYFKC